MKDLILNEIIKNGIFITNQLLNEVEKNSLKKDFLNKKNDKLFKINVCSKNCGSRSKAETIRLQWKGTSKTIWTYEGNDMIDQVLNLIKINNSLPSSKLYCRDFKGNFYLK